MYVYLVACATACLSGGAGSLRSIYCLSLEAIVFSFESEPPSTCIAFLSVHSDTAMDPTMDPRCVRAANALMRLCICTGSSELSMFAKHISLSY